MLASLKNNYGRNAVGNAMHVVFAEKKIKKNENCRQGYRNFMAANGLGDISTRQLNVTDQRVLGDTETSCKEY